MNRPVVLVFPLLAGCLGHFDSVDQACKNNVRGDKDASAQAIDVVQRIGCFRRYAGISAGPLDPHVTQATEAHGRYLAANPDQLYSNWAAEASGTGFTGADAYSRLDAADYLLTASGMSTLVWEVLGYVDPAYTRAMTVDQGMHNPFLRDVYLSPSWQDSGYTEFAVDNTALSYMNIVLYYPSGSHSDRPVVYPIDGQTDVPTSWENLAVGDPGLAGIPAVTGYPITFTCGSARVVSGSNPLDISVASSVITGPNGAVDHKVVLPGLFTFGVENSTAILFPTSPLEPNTEYIVDVSLAWIDNNKEITTTFTTGGS